MILTKNQHSRWLALGLSLFWAGAGSTAAANPSFNCVRDLLPITGKAALHVKRSGVERPFSVSDKYLVFPEVSNDRVTGFYVYSDNKAAYYDMAGDRALADFDGSDLTLYELVAQPNGLETIAIQLLPGFRSGKTVTQAPVVLGTTIMPVVGAVVSRGSSALKSVYSNPADVHESDLQEWIYQRMARRPASVKNVIIRRKLLHLSTRDEKSATELQAPLRAEMAARKAWVRSRNLDEESFRKLARLMDGACR